MTALPSPSLLDQRVAAYTQAIIEEGSIDAAMSRSAELHAVGGLISELWRQNLAWEVLLDEGRPGFTTTGGQRAWMRRWLDSKASVFNGSGRQRGKSLHGYAVLDQHARQWRKARVRWCGLTIDTARAIVSQAMGDYLLTCPEELRPVAEGDDWRYPNGSLLIVIGTDAKTFRRGRGFARIGVDVRDEYGFYQDPEAVDRALNPGLMVPGLSGEPGRVLYSTTPSESPAHASNTVAEAHLARGAYEHETFEDNPRVDPEAVIRGAMERSGETREEVLASTAFRREYKGERVVEEKRAAVPRWTQRRGIDPTKHALVVDLPRPEFFDAYVCLDPGKKVDPHAALVAWFDFARQLLYFEYELELPSVRYVVGDLARELKLLETTAFGEKAWDGTLLGAEDWKKDYGELPEYLQRSISKTAPRQPYLRVGDNDDLLLNTLSVEHGIAIFPTKKDDKHLAVDAFNALVGEGRVMIHPRCTRLFEQLNTTIWNTQRTAWERTQKDHGDLIDCAVYIARNVRRGRDPRPKHVDSYTAAIQRIQEAHRIESTTGFKPYRPR